MKNLKQNPLYEISWLLMFSIETLSPESIFSSLLRSKTATWISVFLACLNKILIAWLYTDLEGDKSLYLLFSKSLLEGNSLLEGVNLAETGQSILVYDPAVTSPLYSILAAPVLWITRSYSTTSFAIDIIAWLLFFTGLYKVALASFIERWVANLFVLCVGFFLFPHEMSSGPKDTLAIGFLLWSVYFIYRLINNRRSRATASVLLACSLCALGLTKYLYSPLILLSVLLLLMYSIHLKDMSLLICFSSTATLCIVIIFTFLMVLLPSIQSVANMDWESLSSWDKNTFTKGWFPHNLDATFPFISSSVINTNFWGVQLSGILRVSFTSVKRAFQLLDFFFIISLTVWQLKKKTLHFNRTLFFILFSFSFFIIGSLLYMSLTHKGIHYKAERMVGSGWTYVSDARSFLFPIISLQILFFFILFKTGYLNPVLKNFLFLLFFTESVHGLYFTSKQMVHYRSVKAKTALASPVKRLTKGLVNLKKHYKDVALITSDAHLRRYATLNNITTYSFSNLPCKEAALSSKALYVIATLEADSALIEKCSLRVKLQATDAVPPFDVHFYQTK